jgi:hypothetical protein
MACTVPGDDHDVDAGAAALSHGTGDLRSRWIVHSHDADQLIVRFLGDTFQVCTLADALAREREYSFTLLGELFRAYVHSLPLGR